MIQILGLFCCATFFGAALYISLVQHPAILAAGVRAGEKFFPPMYKRAAPLQITLALLGFIAGIALWYQGMGLLWLIGALFLISVVPITLIFIKPINDILLNPKVKSIEFEPLLLRWGAKHWIRTIVSGVAFVLYLIATVGINA